MTTSADFDRLLATASLVRQFSALISAGVSLVRSLRLLEENTSNRELAEVIADIRGRIDDGSTLSNAMAAHPDWFSPVGISLVKAGEVAGVLDETMERSADLLDRTVELAERFRLYRLLARMAEGVGGISASDCEAEIRRVLTDARERLDASLFCYNFGVMLASGVPIKLALSTAAEALDAASAAKVQEIADTCDTFEPFNETLAGRLEEVPGLPGVAMELFRVGLETGLLDIMSLRASDLLRLEVEREILSAMARCLQA